ncbi:hypothetical protein ACIQZB_38760 [Streptomyces sp. NPDC097727]|uniref:hypothetical protein n=1 Tax=Streptomyces sp. NPDC097727 TaxID=3366092 RepID=UPI00381E649D
MRHPDDDRALVCLSRDGGDAVVVRGFDVPDDSSACTHLRHLIVTSKSDWLGQRVGSLMAFDFDAFLAGDRTADVLYTRKSERLWPGTPGPATI